MDEEVVEEVVEEERRERGKSRQGDAAINKQAKARAETNAWCEGRNCSPNDESCPGGEGATDVGEVSKAHHVCTRLG